MRSILFLFLFAFILFGNPIVFMMHSESDQQIILSKDMYCYSDSTIVLHSRGESLSSGYIESNCAESKELVLKLKEENNKFIKNVFLFRDYVFYFLYFWIFLLVSFILYKLLYKKKEDI